MFILTAGDGVSGAARAIFLTPLGFLRIPNASAFLINPKLLFASLLTFSRSPEIPLTPQPLRFTVFFGKIALLGLCPFFGTRSQESLPLCESLIVAITVKVMVCASGVGRI